MSTWIRIKEAMEPVDFIYYETIGITVIRRKGFKGNEIKWNIENDRLTSMELEYKKSKKIGNLTQVRLITEKIILRFERLK